MKVSCLFRSPTQTKRLINYTSIWQWAVEGMRKSNHSLQQISERDLNFPSEETYFNPLSFFFDGMSFFLVQ